MTIPLTKLAQYCNRMGDPARGSVKEQDTLARKVIEDWQREVESLINSLKKLKRRAKALLLLQGVIHRNCSHSQAFFYIRLSDPNPGKIPRSFCFAVYLAADSPRLWF